MATTTRLPRLSYLQDLPHLELAQTHLAALQQTMTVVLIGRSSRAAVKQQEGSSADPITLTMDCNDAGMASAHRQPAQLALPGLLGFGLD